MRKILTKTQAVNILEQIQQRSDDIDLFKVFPNSKLHKLTVQELEKKIFTTLGEEEIAAVVEDPVDA